MDRVFAFLPWRCAKMCARIHLFLTHVYGAGKETEARKSQVLTVTTNFMVEPRC